MLYTDPKVNGILVQLPLPGHLDEQAIIERIAQHKVTLSNMASENNNTYQLLLIKYVTVYIAPRTSMASTPSTWLSLRTRRPTPLDALHGHSTALDSTYRAPHR
jgi:Tetrahydrofolate dehydrogenase/cyclohydrolase, catalytic domain